MKRASGLLLHISSLPSPYGIGTFGAEAYEFVDFLKSAGQHYWQILPITHPSSFNNSPYQAFSTYAGNPYFIDLDMLSELGLLEKSDYEGIDFGEEGRVDFDALAEKKMPLLFKAARASREKYSAGFNVFTEKNSWVKEYALYMTIKAHQDDKPWDEWEDCYKYCDEAALLAFFDANKDEIIDWEFIQFLFFDQWQKLKAYANESEVMLIGDIPIYVAYDSVDVWKHPELFELDEAKRPTLVAGCPPDDFCKDGQKWGSPLYNYAHMELDGYNWMINRIDYMCNLYDVLRIDHFRGFDSYYAIPVDAPATEGTWREGPGMKLFNSLNYWMGRKRIIAEDLGIITDSVRKLLEDAGYPGMKVMEFAFNKWDGASNSYLPHHYDEKCVAYLGTHDNETLMQWKSGLDDELLDFVKTYIGNHDDKYFADDMISTLMRSKSDLTILMPQDLLEMGPEARLNAPGTTEGVWTWRLKPGELTSEVAEKLLAKTKAFGRL